MKRANKRNDQPMKQKRTRYRTETVRNSTQIFVFGEKAKKNYIHNSMPINQVHPLVLCSQREISCFFTILGSRRISIKARAHTHPYIYDYDDGRSI